MKVRTLHAVAAITLSVALSSSAVAAGTSAQHVDGAALNLYWAVPFVGLLLSIALLPLIAARFWHHHYGKVASVWALTLLVPFTATFGLEASAFEFLHVILLEYVPFIVVLFTLYTISGGVLLDGQLSPSPGTNTKLLAIGTFIASVAGTTGASVLLIRPLLRANLGRRHNVHVVVFFIFLVSNIGGSLTPLGDPPLFIGFLKGVDFFWPAIALWQPTLLLSAALLALFYAWDSFLFARDHSQVTPEPQSQRRPVKLKGWLNICLLAAVVATILGTAAWKNAGHLDLGGIHVDYPSIVRIFVLLGLAALSLRMTPNAYRLGNGFTWGPILEVAKLFAAIFTTIVPMIAMLKAGDSGPFASALALVSNPDGSPNNLRYFWLTGVLSSVLDNAPTYLVFFNAAGGDAQTLMGPLHTTLAAISAGAVFMGAVTYIGNAPNFMVKAIAEEAGVKMPSFFGYIAWSAAILFPCFIVVGWLFFEGR